MAHALADDEVLAGQWPIRNMVDVVRSIIDKFEHRLVQKESLPQGLIQELYENIDNIEAEILRRQSALSLSKHQAKECDVPHSEDQVYEAPAVNARKEDDLKASEHGEAEPIDSQNFYGASASEESRPIVTDQQGMLHSLKDDIKAIQSVVRLRMDSMPTKKRNTSSMVSFSILEEEMTILDVLLEHVTTCDMPAIGLDCSELEKKLMALPTQLNALFNMEIKEAAQEGTDIDDKIMLHIVVENQKRTNILRHLNSIAKKVQGVTHGVM